MTTPATIRAFIAVMLPAEAREYVVAQAAELAADLGAAERCLRWTRPEGLHFTFHFWRHLPVQRTEEILQVMTEAAREVEPFTLHTDKIGAFPNARKPRVVWAGVGGNLDKLGRLATSIGRELGKIGYRPDHPFKPHLTLARVRDHRSIEDLRALSDALEREQAKATGGMEFRVEELTLVRSELNAAGSIYTSLGTARLSDLPSPRS